MSYRIDRLSVKGFISGQAFEKRVKEYFQNGYIVERIDSKKHLPDFIVNTGSYVFFVECKVKLDCKTVEQAIKKWKNQQPDQYTHQMEMFNAGWDIALFVLIKTGAYRIAGGKIFGLLSEH